VKSSSFHREAEREYAEATAHDARISPALGIRFYEEIERLITDIRARPTLYRFHSGKCRRHFSTVFPFGLLYEDRSDGVRNLAVMPLRRDPVYWSLESNACCSVRFHKIWS
jgi:hypothetical protein